jgi:hypothetical protein
MDAALHASMCARQRASRFAPIHPALMLRDTLPTAMIGLPALAGRTALRAGLMAMRVTPCNLPSDRRSRDIVLQRLGLHPETVVFLDVSRGASATAPTLPQLDAVMPRDHSRRRVFLTRLSDGHVSPGERRWARALGFADLLAEFDPADCEGELRIALDSAALKLSLPRLEPVDLTRYARVFNGVRSMTSPRTTIRSLTGLSAEALAAQLSRSLDIHDRSHRLLAYPACFVGAEAVDWLSLHCRRSRTEAVLIGQALEALGLLDHVVHEHPFLDSRLFFRLAWSAAADRVDLGAVWSGLLGGGVTIADRSHLGKVYSQCWVGSEAVNWVHRQFGLARHEARIVMHRLMQCGLIDHVTLSRPVIDGAYFYRFTGLPETTMPTHRPAPQQSEAE